MNSVKLIEQLELNAPTIASLVEQVDAAQSHWSPGPGKWSIIEVMRHLVDEEVEDFRTRLDATLHHPEQDWPPIDPEGWAVARNYRDSILEATLDKFLLRRAESVSWLQGLDHPQWDRQHLHPEFGGISAGDLLLSWIAHDLLHVRQITRLKFQYAQSIAAGFSTRYAGDW